MTRQHFEAFAKALKNSNGTLTAQEVAKICAIFNPDFNARRFLDACSK